VSEKRREKKGRKGLVSFQAKGEGRRKKGTSLSSLRGVTRMGHPIEEKERKEKRQVSPYRGEGGEKKPLAACVYAKRESNKRGGKKRGEEKRKKKRRSAATLGGREKKTLVLPVDDDSKVVE